MLVELPINDIMFFCHMCLLDIAVYTILLNTNTTDSNKIKHLLLTIFMASNLFYLTL